MSIYRETTIRWFATCDWCNAKDEITNNLRWPKQDGEPCLSEHWIRDWDAHRDHPPVYCSEVHMERARQVAELKALP